MFACKLFLVLYSLLDCSLFGKSGMNECSVHMRADNEWFWPFSSLFLLLFSIPKGTDSVLNIFIVSLIYLPGTTFLLTLKMRILRIVWYFAHKYLVSLLLFYKVFFKFVYKNWLKRDRETTPNWLMFENCRGVKKL